jgi:hypothetical protein
MKTGFTGLHIVATEWVDGIEVELVDVVEDVEGDNGGK